MSSFVKTKVKAARDAINKKDYEKARELALNVLEYEPSNYHAHVFLGIAFSNLKQYSESEQAYRKAIETDSEQLLAWQGLLKLYEESENWPEALKTLRKLAEIHAKSNDAVKCAEAIQKIIDLRRDTERLQSTRLELAEALSLLLPDSPFYPVLSILPPPDPTNPTATTTFVAQSAVHDSLPILEELVSIHEQEEKAVGDAEVAKRRQRLAAVSPEETRKQVALEILSKSQLPRLYDEVLNHPNTSDDLRRQTESKLLRMKQSHLFSIPTDSKRKEEKARLAAEVEELIKGIVLLKVPDELAWTLLIESKDAERIEDYDFGLLRSFVEVFPESSLAQLIRAYFEYMRIPLSDEEEDEEQAHKDADDELDLIDAMMDAFTSLGNSILAHRIIAELYEQDADYENAIKVAESGLELVRLVEQNWGRPIRQTKKAFKTTLGTSLVHHFPPKHHTRALRYIDEVLAEDPKNIPALMGRGFILQYAKKWSEASLIFAKVAELDADGVEHGLRAKEEHAWCTVMCGDLQAAADELREVIRVLDELEGRDDDKARAWWRLGRCYWDMGVEHRDEAYKYFVTALKRSSTFAPAFTYLGIYYSEYLSPPDPSRASKCFQKAFELDPREAEAARRLAEGFADEGEWDLVEVVARRTIEGEGGLEEGPEAKASRRYLPINAWAWKAVGAVEMSRRNYPPAIEAYQIALRTDVDDHMSWMRLGEAYSKAGRFAAALKALEHARELDPEDWVSSYFIGEVQRQMGLYEEAIKSFERILENRPQELGVLHSIGQSYLDLGRLELSTGFTARAETSFTSAVRLTLELVAASPGFRRVAWKTIADALLQLSSFAVFFDEEAIQDTVSTIVPLATEHPGKGLVDILTYPLALDESISLPWFALQVALAAYEYRLSLGGLNDAASGAAHYDLGIALSTFARRTLDSTRRERAEQEAITQFKHALRLEPSNDAFWLALGNATFLSQPTLSQHSYIRAIELDGKNAGTWTSLGMFYLQHEDVELANEAFYKAQTLDPDYVLAWVGQGLVATANQHHKDASALFEHATGLTAAVPEADLEYATRLFNRVNTSTRSRSASSEALLPAFFVLDRYCKQRPRDATALHLFGLVCERVGHIELGIDLITRAIAVLEAAYEETEDSVTERQFTTAHANVARLRLATGDYEGALESYQVAMSLLPDEPEEEGTQANTQALLAQCQFGSGLANFKLGNLQDALAQFEAAMATAGENATIRGHVVVLLAQTLWAIGTEEAKESAKAQLLQSIEYDPENLMAINTLAGMGILTDDDSLVDAALFELLSLPIDQRQERDPERDVTYLLVQHHLGQGDAQQALSVAEKAVHTEPERTDVRRNLASLTLQSGKSAAALAILGGAAQTHSDFAQLRASLALHSVALCLESGTGATAAEALKLAQKGVMLSPGDRRGWEVLAYIRSRTASS
ncbi:TPR-like protein [Lentinus tigrinus ALCF2SS1-6]|uniref:TPR-like protein n=1 Tax=Lentinus tigrinus ALCF2SS1-6 TaxID=1328759 RepID=A0A5C2SQN0_9APHY|nr:TPR-like protein [Lentinus tigrinus ALCF2SS1-6]